MDDDGSLKLGEGEYGQDKNGGWHARVFGFPVSARLEEGVHEVIEHEDGTITVLPSILISNGNNTKGWHGYLERGVWRAAI